MVKVFFYVNNQVECHYLWRIPCCYGKGYAGERLRGPERGKYEGREKRHISMKTLGDHTTL